jgi:hypothetical protein
VEAGGKTLHVVVTDVDEEEAEELGLARAIEGQVTQLWRRVIKPDAGAEAGEGAEEAAAEEGGEEEEGEGRGVAEWAEQLSVNVVCLPARGYAAKAHAAALAGLKATLEAKWARDEEGAAFVPVKELEASLHAMAPLSREMLAGAAAVPRADSVVAAYYLDKVRVLFCSSLFACVPGGLLFWFRRNRHAGRERACTNNARRTVTDPDHGWLTGYLHNPTQPNPTPNHNHNHSWRRATRGSFGRTRGSCWRS